MKVSIKRKKLFLINCGFHYNMFIIDLDDTLLNTRAKHGFKEARLVALEKIGVSRQLFLRTYLKARDEGKKIVYNSRRHALELGKYGFDKKKVFRGLEETVSGRKLKSFLYSDTILF